VSLNRKRRIFRSNFRAVPSRGRRILSRAVLLAACGSAVTLVVAVSMFLGSSVAPARPPAGLHVGASAGRLAVLDGGTLRVGDQVVRLAGIVAPARGSVCYGAGQVEIDCGVAAANALASLVRGNAVDCTVSGHDGRGRPVATCLAGGKVLNEALVLDGWARAEVDDMRELELSARAAGRGIWRTGS
jgi:endonuclease YncB( thermonuclease family)